MASVEHNITAWVGFIDKYPVIGTVKEGVEWVLAAYYDDPSLCKKKEEQIMELVKSMKMNKAKTDDKKRENGKVDSDVNGESGGASGIPGKYNVEEVPQKELVKYLTNKFQSAHKKQTKKEMEKGKESEELKKIKEAVKKHLNFIGLDSTEPLPVGLPRSKRGEHVFNNGILKFHSKVLKGFTERYSIQSNEILQLGTHTLGLKTEEDIAINMVVNFDSDESYLNSNAEVYGKFSCELSTALRKILMHFDTSNVKDEEKKWANDIIDYMYENEIYVDVFAKAKWINQKHKKLRRFNEVKEEVHDMYKNKRGCSWCIDIMETIQQYFEDLRFNQR